MVGLGSELGFGSVRVRFGLEVGVRGRVEAVWQLTGEIRVVGRHGALQLLA